MPKQTTSVLTAVGALPTFGLQSWFLSSFIEGTTKNESDKLNKLLATAVYPSPSGIAINMTITSKYQRSLVAVVRLDITCTRGLRPQGFTKASVKYIGLTYLAVQGYTKQMVGK
ncbi:hypothetical protein CBL_05240 [Carabus blaptoides fortunei]